jgi:hypothetical protein
VLAAERASEIGIAIAIGSGIATEMMKMHELLVSKWPVVAAGRGGAMPMRQSRVRDSSARCEPDRDVRAEQSNITQ